MPEDGRIYVDPTSGATIFDDGEQRMPSEDDTPIETDSEGRGDIFGIPDELAAQQPTPQVAAPAAPAPAPTPASAPVSVAQPVGDVAPLLHEAERATQAGQRAQAEAQGLYQEAVTRGQRVATRRGEAERAWQEGGITPESVTRFVTEQEQDTRASLHAMGQAQAKVGEAQGYFRQAEGHQLWHTIKSRFPGIDGNDPRLGKLAGNVWALRQASGFRTPYGVLLDEHMETIREHFGAKAPAPAAPIPTPVQPAPKAAPAPAEQEHLSIEDARILGLA